MKTPVLKSLLKIEKGLRSMRFPVNLPIFKDSLFCRPPQGDGWIWILFSVENT